MRQMIARCQSGFEDLLAREIESRGGRVLAAGGGWVQCADLAEVPEDLCFAHQVMIAPQPLAGDSVNRLAGAVLDMWLAAIKDQRIESEWICVFTAAAELDGLGRRMTAVEKTFREQLKKRLGRVARLAVDYVPGGVGRISGLFVFFSDFGKAWVSQEIVRGGQRRMADDVDAPSRSYLKVEEAYGVLGAEPVEGELVVDLGAAPGGWSYSAAKRGARVIAIDNGPLKGGALDHPLIEHRLEDAFGFRPNADEPVDWLFCDLVEDPHHVARNLITPWLINGWCRRFVVMLKIGRVNASELLAEMTAANSAFVRTTSLLRVRHLYHDREEFTLVGELKPRETKD
jgi:23S rRNA (cytidine2498-2'-O)-methyltransferase